MASFRSDRLPRACLLMVWVAAVSLSRAGDVCANVVFDWVTVGNPGNGADPATGLGSVASTFQISKFETTNSQYVEFLNAADPTGANTLGLYNNSMTTGGSTASGGINFTIGAPNGAKYSVKVGLATSPSTG